jgi:hypothetical protein
VLRAAVLATLLALLTACAPAVVTPPPGTPTGAAPTSSPRPRDIDISGIPPCELLTDAQRAELGLDGEPGPYTSRDALFGDARSCTIRRLDAQPAVTLGISMVVEYGIERFAEPGVVDGVERIEVLGYPAVLSPPPASMPDNCLVAIDVAPGQMVGVLLSDGGNARPIRLEQLCAEVPRFAESVMTTLVAR